MSQRGLFLSALVLCASGDAVAAAPRAKLTRLGPVSAAAKLRMDHLAEVRAHVGRQGGWFKLEGRVATTKGFGGFVDLDHAVDLVETDDGTYYARLPQSRIVPLDDAHWRYDSLNAAALHFDHYRHGEARHRLLDPAQAYAYAEAHAKQQARLGPLPAEAPGRVASLAGKPGVLRGTHAVSGEPIELHHPADVIRTEQGGYYLRTADDWIVPLRDLHLVAGAVRRELIWAETSQLRDPSRAAVYEAALRGQEQASND